MEMPKPSLEDQIKMSLVELLHRLLPRLNKQANFKWSKKLLGICGSSSDVQLDIQAGSKEYVCSLRWWKDLDHFWEDPNGRDLMMGINDKWYNVDRNGPLGKAIMEDYRIPYSSPDMLKDISKFLRDVAKFCEWERKASFSSPSPSGWQHNIKDHRKPEDQEEATESSDE